MLEIYGGTGLTTVRLVDPSDDELLRLALEGVPLTANALERPCEMYLDHGSARPSVTQGHHRHPVYLQNRVWGRIQDGTLIWLCGTCHDNVHAWAYYLLGERRMPAPPPRRAIREAEYVLEWYRSVSPAA